MTTTDIETRRERLRERLAEIGVPLFRPSLVGAPPLGDAEGPALIVDLLRSGDARLVASIPCVLALHPAAVPPCSTLAESEKVRLGSLHYVARGLIASRSPDLSQVLGRAPKLAPCDAEPRGLPDPNEDSGETALAAARDRDAPSAGDAIDLFDKWLRIRRLERRSREPAPGR